MVHGFHLSFYPSVRWKRVSTVLVLFKLNIYCFLNRMKKLWVNSGLDISTLACPGECLKCRASANHSSLTRLESAIIRRHEINLTAKWMIRGGSRIFFRRGAPLRNGITDWWPDVNTSCIRNRRGGGAHPLQPPPRSASVLMFGDGKTSLILAWEEKLKIISNKLWSTSRYSEPG